MKQGAWVALAAAAGALALWLAVRHGGGPEPVEAVSPLGSAAQPREDADGRPAEAAPVRDTEPPEREVVAAEAPEAAEEGEALLTITALDRDTGAPLSDVRVSLWPRHPECERLAMHVDSHEARLGEAPQTDRSGTVVFRLPPGVPTTITAEGEEYDVGTAERDVPALAADEHWREVLALAVGYDLRFFGRVVDSEGRPIYGATVRFLNHRTSLFSSGQRRDVFETRVETSTDPNGVFEAQVPSWEGLVGRVDAEGFGPALFHPVRGHEERGSALPIELSRGAVLRGSVAGSKAGLQVRVETYGYQLVQNPEGRIFSGAPSWETWLKQDGTWEFADLPPGAELEVQLLKGTDLLRHVSELVLEPGEERVLDWWLGSGATLRGTVVVAGGEVPLGGQRVWLVPLGGFHRPGFMETYWDPMDRTFTDRGGSFVFEDVAPGSWLVGPAPTRRPRSNSVAPVAQLVEVPPGVLEVEVAIEAYRGLSIRGRVVGPDGEPIRETLVIGSSSSSWLDTEGEDDGTFTLGPLVPGVYQVRATRRFSLYADSESVSVEAGADDLVLHLRRGASLAGIAVDA